MSNVNKRLIAILTIAFILRLAFALMQETLFPYFSAGSDSDWYLLNGYQLWRDTNPGPLPVAPLYLLFLGFWQLWLPHDIALIAIRVMQCLMGTASCFFAYQVARTLANQRAGFITSTVLAISPVFVIEPTNILTETVYIFFIIGGLWTYMSFNEKNIVSVRHTIIFLASIGILFGLATLTRAVALLFPLGLALHWIIVKRRIRRSTLLGYIVILLSVYMMVVSIWTIYNLERWNYLVVGAQGMFSFLYLGATETGWIGPEAVDAGLEEQVGTLNPVPNNPEAAYQQGAAQIVESDPIGWISRRLNNLVDAYVQPHGTSVFPGESLKEAVIKWWQNERNLNGLINLTQKDHFWIKLTIYIFHYAGLLFGLGGMWLSSSRLLKALPLMGFILYTTLVHLVLLALPRYLFPMHMLWWIFAGIFLSAIINEAQLIYKRINQTVAPTSEQFGKYSG